MRISQVSHHLQFRWHDAICSVWKLRRCILHTPKKMSILKLPIKSALILNLSYFSEIFRWKTLINNTKQWRRVFSNSSTRISATPTWVLLMKSSWTMWSQYWKKRRKIHILMLTVMRFKKPQAFFNLFFSCKYIFVVTISICLGFVEMMSAYMPDFSTIETTKVYQWIVDLENEMSNKKKNVAHTNEIAIK